MVGASNASTIHVTDENVVMHTTFDHDNLAYIEDEDKNDVNHNSWCRPSATCYTLDRTLPFSFIVTETHLTNLYGWIRSESASYQSLWINYGQVFVEVHGSFKEYKSAGGRITLNKGEGCLILSKFWNPPGSMFLQLLYRSMYRKPVL